MFRTCAIGMLFLVLYGWSAQPCCSQDWAKSLVKNAHRIDLRTLGYPEVNEIPADSSAITSLVSARDGKIYGATSGRQAYLFVFDPAINKVRHLGKIADQKGVYHSVVQGADGAIYIGSGINLLEPVHISKGGIGKEHIDATLWRDIKKHFAKDPGGHLYRYDPAQSNVNVKLPNMPCEVKDLGIPVANNAIHALASSPDGKAIYGLTYPDGHFFVYDVGAEKLTDLGPIDAKIVFHGPRRDERSLPKALICDEVGRIFTSGANGRLVYYCPKNRKIVPTELTIPGDYYHAQFYEDYAVVEYLAKDASGMIWGGSSDGHLFRFDPRKMTLVNLGKPRADRRLRCLAIGNDGRIYMMAGRRLPSRPCQFYCYDPKRGGYEDMGLLIVDRSPHYYWRGYQFDAMATGADGTIYFGESDRRSHLFLYVPEGSPANRSEREKTH